MQLIGFVGISYKYPTAFGLISAGAAISTCCCENFFDGADRLYSIGSVSDPKIIDKR